MKRRWGGAAALCAGMAAAGLSGCSTVREATGMQQTGRPMVPSARLSRLTPEQRAPVRDAEQALQEARDQREKARREADGVADELDQARTAREVAHREVNMARSRAESGTAELSPGAEERAALEERPAVQPTVDEAERAEKAAKEREHYLKALHQYAEARVRVADHRVLVAQSAVDQAAFDALQAHQPQELVGLDQTPVEAAHLRADREEKLAEVRHDQESQLDGALTRLGEWKAAARDAEQPYSVGEATQPEALPPL